MIPPTARDILVDLVATPSVSGDERRAVERFCDHASALGLDASVDEVGNGVAIRESVGTGGVVQPMREIVLLGHIDTVPGRILVRVDEFGFLHGRGSVDAKGSLVAMLAAAAVAEVPHDVRVVVVAAVEEEVATSAGARHIAATRRPDACIIGEPSGWSGVTLGYKGRLLVRLVVEKENAHSAGPDGSAADALHAWWDGVRVLCDRLSPASGGAFDRVQSTIQSVSTHLDGMTQHADLLGGVRLPPALGPAMLRREIESLDLPAGASLEFSGGEPAYRVSRNDPVVRALSSAIRAQGGRPAPRVKTGTADLNVVGPVWGCPIAAYGPGDAALDHTPHERLDLAELDRAVAVLGHAIASLALELRATASVV